MIRLDDVSCSFDEGRTRVVRGVSLEIAEGETVVLLGSSGCGKTTTLRTINRLVRPSAGRVLVGGTDVAAQDPLALRRSIGYVFQDIGLFPHRTVSENVETVPRLLGWPRPRRRDRTAELLGLVGLDPAEHAGRRPHELSGGQQQRVGIARALAADPPVLLMDEPFGALDAVTRDQLQAEVIRLRELSPRTIVFVTHDLFEALRLGDRIAVMDAGRMLQVGTPRELLESPATPFVSGLFDRADRAAALLTELRS